MTEAELEEERRLPTAVRVLGVAALRTLLVGILLETVMFFATTPALDYGFGMTGWQKFERYVLPCLVVEGLLAVGFGSLRAVEALTTRVRPEGSYRRRFLLGVLAGVAVFLVTVAVLFQTLYVIGLCETQTLAGAFRRIADSDWFSSHRGSWDSLRRPGPGSLVELAAPFAIAGFSRARRWPLRDQMIVQAIFVFYAFSPVLVLMSMIGKRTELWPWTVIALTSLSVPVIARHADRLEARRLPSLPRAVP